MMNKINTLSLEKVQPGFQKSKLLNKNFKISIIKPGYPFALIIFFLFINLISCKDDETKNVEPGKITFYFLHSVNNEPLEFDTLKYINAAGNPYLISEIQYFISDVTLYKSDGTSKVIDDWKDIHYVEQT